MRPATAAPGASAPAGAVDVTAILDDLASKNPEKLDWRNSIVDLMKLVGMDSGLASRKELAKDLNYTGDTSDSASMNIWLHKVGDQKDRGQRRQSSKGTAHLNFSRVRLR